MRGREHDEREEKKKRGRTAEEGNVSKDLSEARIANCYYPEDNKTVTIFADRASEESTRGRAERNSGDQKAREERQTRKRMTRGPAAHAGNTSGR